MAVYDHLGNEYGTLRGMCKKYNITPTAYLHRLKRGCTPEVALVTPVGKLYKGQEKKPRPPKENLPGNRTRKKCRDHLGNEYDSIIEMCRAYKISYAAYHYRLERGWTVEKALTRRSFKAPVITDK